MSFCLGSSSEGRGFTSFVPVQWSEIRDRCHEIVADFDRVVKQSDRDATRYMVKLANRKRRRWYWIGLRPYTKQQAINSYGAMEWCCMTLQFSHHRHGEAAGIARQLIRIGDRHDRIFLSRDDYDTILRAIP